MQPITLNPFYIIGMAIRTCNVNGQAATDIPQLWGKFLSQELHKSIPTILSRHIYCVYTEYEGDHMAPYTTILGYQVSTLENVPEGLRGMSFDGGSYQKINCRGNLNKGLIIDAWKSIWSSTADRAYTADFEIYDERAANPLDAEVDIYLSIK